MSEKEAKYAVPALPLPTAQFPCNNGWATVVASVWGRDEYDEDEGDANGTPWGLLLLLHPQTPHFEVVETSADRSDVHGHRPRWGQRFSHGRFYHIADAVTVYEQCGGDR